MISKLGRILGVCGLVALLSLPLTLFLWDWHMTWVGVIKAVFGVFGLGFWFLTSSRSPKVRFGGRSVFYSSFQILFIALAVAGLVVVNYYFYLNPHRMDLTEERVFSLSQQTIDVLNAMDDVVEVRAFYGPGDPEFSALGGFLNRFKYASDKFVYEFVDPHERPDLVQDYSISMRGPRIVLKYKDRQARVKFEPGKPAEEALTSALIQVTSLHVSNQVCFTLGHGENSIGGNDPRASMTLWVEALKTEGYKAQNLSLLENPQIPDSCKVVVVAGPKKDFAPEEIKEFSDYLDAGGLAMVLVGAGDSSSLNKILDVYGVQVGRDVIVDPRLKTPFMIVSDPQLYPQSHPIFERFFRSGMVVLNQLQAVFPLARSTRRRMAPAGLDVTELVRSTDKAWAETSPIKQGQKPEFDEDRDIKGPVSMAVAVSALSSPAAKDRKAMKLVVFGSSQFATDANFRYPFNPNLLMNTLAWLTHEESKISIRPRFRAASWLMLDEDQMKFITFFSSDILPLLILTLGIAIWQMRRWS